MRSDVIHVTNEGSGIGKALAEVELVASYKALPQKQALHLRLLTEEMMGMMRALTGEREADFWIDDEDGTFRLHLEVQTIMNAEMRKKLLSASSKGENTAAKGVMGKIRDLFERFLEPSDGQFSSAYLAGLTYTGADFHEMSSEPLWMWSFNQYKSYVMESGAKNEAWDELEKSIVARLADEVKIGVTSRNVEMVIYKKY